MSLPRFPQFGTNAIHVGQEPEQWHMNQVVPPISVASTYKQIFPGEAVGHDYSRCGNPTRDVLEKNIAALEDARYCHTFSSGMASISAVINYLKTGDHILCMDDIYGGTQRYINRISVPQHGISVDYVDMTNLNNIEYNIKPNTKMIWFESPSNPLLKVVDIAAVAHTAKSINPQIVVVVDNTFMSPFFQRPISLGADIVVHSVTKYINGHADVIMGAAVTDSETIHDHLYLQQIAVGAVPSPFDCYLTNRGIKTLHIRMQSHYENALAVARYLETNARIEKVIYPGLPSHPQHELHKRQSTGMSGMISFFLKGGLEESRTFCNSLKIFSIAVSLGGFESLVELPAKMSHASVAPEKLAKAGITDSLIRLSIGVEDVDDIIADLNQALKTAIPKLVL